MIKRKKSKVKRNRIAALAFIFLVTAVAFTGTAFARYVYSNRQEAEMISANFHVSSDYLEKGSALKVYEISGLDSYGVDIEVYNYEKKNVSQISSIDVKYKIKLKNFSESEITVKYSDQNGILQNAVPDNGYYTIPKGSKMKHTIHVGAPIGTMGEVEILAEPYAVKLKAGFKNKSTAAHCTIEDLVNHKKITIETNDYMGPVTIKWLPAAEVSPDNTNPIMSSWQDEISGGGEGSFSVEKYHTYELIFLKNSISPLEPKKEFWGNTVIIE